MRIKDVGVPEGWSNLREMRDHLEVEEPTKWPLAKAKALIKLKLLAHQQDDVDLKNLYHALLWGYRAGRVHGHTDHYMIAEALREKYWALVNGHTVPENRRPYVTAAELLLKVYTRIHKKHQMARRTKPKGGKRRG